MRWRYTSGEISLRIDRRFESGWLEGGYSVLYLWRGAEVAGWMSGGRMGGGSGVQDGSFILLCGLFLWWRVGMPAGQYWYVIGGGLVWIECNLN